MLNTQKIILLPAKITINMEDKVWQQLLLKIEC